MSPKRGQKTIKQEVEPALTHFAERKVFGMMILMFGNTNALEIRTVPPMPWRNPLKSQRTRSWHIIPAFFIAFLVWGHVFACVRRRKVPLKVPKKRSQMPLEGPMLAWDVAMQEAEENRNSTGEVDAWLATSREAVAEDMLLGPGVGLQVSTNPVLDVRQKGVARVASVLSHQTAQDMYNFVLQELSTSCAAVKADPTTKHFYFSRHIRQTRASKEEPQTRWELQLPWRNLTAKVLTQLLQGPLGSAFAELAGEDAELWEFTALVAGPGAVAQQLHCDVRSEEPALFTAFVALQDVEHTMGPTRFLPETHTTKAHLRFAADKSRFLNTVPSRVALLHAGDAALYDGRVLHCGTGNASERKRLLLVVTVRHKSDAAVKAESRKTHRAFAARITLADFQKSFDLAVGFWMVLERCEC